MSLKTIAIHDRPDTRISHDPSMCTTPELLAAVIGGDDQLEIANNLLERFGGSIARICNAAVPQLTMTPGIGIATATRIKASMALGSRINQATERVTINSPADAAALVTYDMSTLEKEQLRTILLNTRNVVIDIVTICTGTVNSSQVKIGEVIRPALQYLASAIIVVHNHPSGDPTPSPDDVAVTRAIVSAGKLMDIDVLDHLIICNGRHVSLKERGLGFS
jgi:DNA repair protein RadC